MLMLRVDWTTVTTLHTGVSQSSPARLQVVRACTGFPLHCGICYEVSLFVLTACLCGGYAAS